MRLLQCAAVCVLFLTCAAAQTPAVADNGILNAASYTTAGNPGFAVAPGSLVAIFGSGLAAGLSQADSVPLSTSMANVSVSFGGTPAPLLFVSPNQVNAQLPWEALPQGAASGSLNVVVTFNGNASQPKTVQLAQFSPAIFTFPGTGLGPAVAVNSADGSVSQPDGLVPGVSAHPASRGSIIIIYANGLGPVNPPAQNGAPSLDTLRRTTTNPVVLIGGVAADLLFAGMSPQFPGVNQVNARVPATAPIGNAVPLQLQVGGLTTSDQVTIAVGQ